MVPKTHLLPNDDQDNERDDDNHQQHEHRRRHREFRSQGWGARQRHNREFCQLLVDSRIRWRERGQVKETDWGYLPAGGEVSRIPDYFRGVLYRFSNIVPLQLNVILPWDKAFPKTLEGSPFGHP